jgi:hypothetical protein
MNCADCRCPHNPQRLLLRLCISSKHQQLKTGDVDRRVRGVAPDAGDPRDGNGRYGVESHPRVSRDIPDKLM